MDLFSNRADALTPSRLRSPNDFLVFVSSANQVSHSYHVQWSGSPRRCRQATERKTYFLPAHGRSVHPQWARRVRVDSSGQEGQLVPESRVIQKMVFRKGLCLFLFVAKWTAKKSNKALWASYAMGRLKLFRRGCPSSFFPSQRSFNMTLRLKCLDTNI